MVTIKVKLRPSSVVNREGSIVYLVTKSRVSRLITTPYKVFPHEWDEKRASVIYSSDDRLKAVAESILHDVERLESIVKTLTNKELDYTVDDIIAAYQQVEQNNGFFAFMESIIVRLKQLNRRTTALNYQTTLERLRKFRNGKDIRLESIDYRLMEDYEAYLKQQGLVPNTISFYMKILRAVYNRAIQGGLLRDRQPFRTVNTSFEKTRKRAISLNNIKRLRNINLSCEPSLAFARDIFMFLFFCRGMSFVDAAFLKKTDIKNGVLIYRRHKTNQPLYIKIEQVMSEVIERYTIKGSIYLLPLINDFGDERKQYIAAIHKINYSLKILGQMLHLHIPLTTYVSRHTWATIAKQRNIPISIISEALGHESEKTTQVYLASIDTSVIDRANSKVIKSL